MDWLTRYLIPDSGRFEWEHVHATGDGWLTATDDRSLLAVRGDAAGVRSAASFHPTRFAVTRLLLDATPPADALHADLFDLWRWLDRVEREWCPACGPGRPDEALHEWCSVCDGRRWVFPDPEPTDADTVTVCGHPFDRNRLAWWLAPELADLGVDCRLWLVEIPRANLDAPARLPVPALIVAGERWRVAVGSQTREECPARYRTYLPGAGVWYTHRRCPVARLSGADWALERGADGFDLFGTHE